jgi:adenylosuccinate synthase
VTSRHAVQINGISEVVITKLDVLSGLTRSSSRCPTRTTARRWSACRRSTTSWPLASRVQDVQGLEGGHLEGQEYEDLPKAAKIYLKFLEGYLKVKVTMVSVGKDRDKTILRR